MRLMNAWQNEPEIGSQSFQTDYLALADNHIVSVIGWFFCAFNNLPTTCTCRDTSDPDFFRAYGKKTLSDIW